MPRTTPMPLHERLAATAETRHAAILGKRGMRSTTTYGRSTWCFGLGNRNLAAIFKPMLLVALVAGTSTPLLLIYIINPRVPHRYVPFDGTAWCSATASGEAAFGYLVVAVSFLLVFRLNRAAARYYEARQLCGRVISHSRELVVQANALLRERPRARDSLCALVVAFPVAFATHINPSTYNADTFSDKIEGLLEAVPLEAVLRASNRPLALVQMMTDILHVAFSADTPITAAKYAQLQCSVKGLATAVGGCERIQGTPLPLIYVAHLRTCLVLILCAIPIVHCCEWQWANIPLSLLIAFALLGIEAASHECERPFAASPTKNHLHVNRYAVLISTEAQALLSMREELAKTTHASSSPNKEALARARTTVSVLGRMRSGKERKAASTDEIALTSSTGLDAGSLDPQLSPSTRRSSVG